MISTEIVDTVRGSPAARVPVELDYFITGHGWKQVGQGISNEQGRVETFGEPPAEGIYRLSFDVASRLADAFFPSISVVIDVRDSGAAYHLPLLLSAYGYSVYRA